MTRHEYLREQLYLPDPLEQLNDVEVPVQSPQRLLVLQFLDLLRCLTANHKLSHHEHD